MRLSLYALLALLSACGQPPAPDLSASSGIEISVPPVSRCMNLGNALEAPAEGDWGYFVRQQDLVRLREAGFDTIRLPVKWSAHAERDAPYTISPEILARVDEIVEWANELELNIIVNVHHYEALNQDPDVHEPRLEAIWTQLARHYANAPDRLIFETINEPHSAMTTQRTDALNRRILSGLRAEHPDRWVILGTAFWGNLSALEQSRPTYDPRVLLTYHDYSPFEFTHQGASWTDQTRTGVRWGSRRDLAQMMSRLDRAAAVREQTRMPVLVGEFGVYEGVPVEQRTAWTRAMRQAFESREMPWCYWDFAGALKAYDIESEAWIPQIRSALLEE